MAENSIVPDDRHTPSHSLADGPTDHVGPPLAPAPDHGGTGPAAALPSILAAPQLPGELGRLGGYRVLGVIGRGGMGIVLRAEDVALQRPVALKVMHPELALQASARQRFIREARAIAAIDHEHIVRVYAVGEQHGLPFFAMELLHGESLADRLGRGPLPISEIVRLGKEVARGLQAAHALGLVHRDIKPANIFLANSGVVGSDESNSPRITPRPGLTPAMTPHETPRTNPRVTGHNLAHITQHAPVKVKILDFGLVRGGATATDREMTCAGAVIGTPAYISPEQAQGQKVTSACDLFSLGCVLYRMCTQQLPFPGHDSMAILAAQARGTPIAPQTLTPEVPRALNDLILRLLAIDPAQRPASAGEVAAILEQLERGMVATPPAATHLQPLPPRPARRRLRRIAIGVASVIVAFIFLDWFTAHGELLLESGVDEMEVTITAPRREPIKQTLGPLSPLRLTLPLGTVSIHAKEKKSGRYASKHVEMKRGQIETIRLESLFGATANVELKVPANKFWTSTGIQLVAGMEVEIRASGIVDAAPPEMMRPYYSQVPPEGREERVAQVPQPSLPGLCLLGKSGASVFFVGKECRFTVDATRVGELQLGINDDIVEDNSGEWTVRIRTKEPL
jgi:serine/threonine protein kinase